VGGFLGTILLGVFASRTINPSLVTEGLFFGESSFFVKELIAVVVAAAYAFIFTYIMLIVINMFTPVRVPKEMEKSGLDEGLHGERAYDEGAL
jgi:Amt family ammonium transporter